MGVNWQSNFSPDGTECVGFVREFSRWFDTQREGANPNPPAGSLYPDECLSFNPDEGIPAELDFYYQELFNQGIDISPAMMSTLPTYSGNTSTNPLERESWIPLQHEINPDNNDEWEVNEDDDFNTTNDAEIPANYVERADWMYHYVARYGGGNVPLCEIKVCSDDLLPDESNSGILRYVESWNEPNRTWTGVQGDFTPEEYAAMASCDFDGHENTVIATGTCNSNDISYPVGVVNADQNIRFVMGAPFDIEYSDATGTQGNGGFNVWDIWVEPMITWFENNRTDQVFIFDVLNFHHYSTSDPANPTGGSWICPEQDQLRLKLEDIFDEMEDRGWKNNVNNPDENREFWVSEFGYDTDESETNGWDFGNPTPNGMPTPTDPVFGNLFPEDLQAQWTVRSYLEMLAAGVDRAMVHELNDVIPAESSAAGWDQKTGLITLEGLPKASWYFVYSMRNILEGFRYAGDESENCTYTISDATNCDPADPLKPTRIYRFENDMTNETVWVVWSPTTCDIVPYEVEINLLSGTGEATGLRLAAPNIDGVIEAPVSIVGNIATVMASETPLFLVEETLTPPPCPEVSVTDVNCGSISFDIDLAIGQSYDSYQIWYGQPADPNIPDFSALGGDLNLFGNISGDATSTTITGLESGTTYSIYFVPQSPNGIPAELCFQTVTTTDAGSICRIDVNDPSVASITYIQVDNDPVQQDNLFDNQDLDFCNGLPDLSTQIPDPTDPTQLIDEFPMWYRYADFAQITIDFTQSYTFDNFFFFDGTSSGVFTVEFWNGSEWELLFNHFTSLLEEWNSVSDFEQPSEGINRIRLTAQSDRARLRELFICGQPACDVYEARVDNVTADCSSAIVNMDEPPPSCNTSFDLRVTEQDDLTGGVTIPVTNQTSVQVPASSVNYGDALIPNITYYAGTNGGGVTTFTTASNGTGCIQGANLLAGGVFGCTSRGFIVPGNVPQNARIQFWLSPTQKEFMTTEHPLVSDPDAITQIVTLEPWNFGYYLATLTGLENGATYTGVYRYITETESSELYTGFGSSSTFTFKVYGPTRWPSGDCGGSTSLVTDDCEIVAAIVEETQTTGSYEFSERTNTSSTPTIGALASATTSATGSDIYYEFQNSSQIKYLYWRWVDVNTVKPWEWIETDYDPCAPVVGKSDDSNINNRQIIARIYPNPSKSILNLLCDDYLVSELFSIDGRKLALRLIKQSANEYQFDTSQLPDGMYFMQITNSAGEREALRFVVQR